jgi:hypothetical protein
LNPLYPPGTIGGACASGPIFRIDPKRRGAVVFIAQVMWGHPRAVRTRSGSLLRSSRI